MEKVTTAEYRKITAAFWNQVATMRDNGVSDQEIEKYKWEMFKKLETEYEVVDQQDTKF